ncbi:hypothetical protein SZ64_14490 [Erythrobacter sp. SG61-1L]|uniref:hypothetical protein n=1 Tax=Erythrobacter sp. SG61-1L TaxID=1603897 RepID=UPI0006C922E4|nr:hypothetical protein [Erythrobacter sp. SG61-1L]KPL69202.1 hypothetical protein SZ64_14490 [Erythrobacter sp. SG61-1L]
MRSKSPAVRRYLRRLTMMMAAYVVLIFAAGYLFRHDPPQGPLAYALALAPALPIIGVIWSVMRLLAEETDEYMRMLFVRQSLFATGFCLTIMTGWEFLQNYELVSQGTHGFGATFIWFVGLGIGAILNNVSLHTEARQ